MKRVLQYSTTTICTVSPLIVALGSLKRAAAVGLSLLCVKVVVRAARRHANACKQGRRHLAANWLVRHLQHRTTLTVRHHIQALISFAKRHNHYYLHSSLQYAPTY